MVAKQPEQTRIISNCDFDAEDVNWRALKDNFAGRKSMDLLRMYSDMEARLNMACSGLYEFARFS